jgi:hypothetical protein
MTPVTAKTETCKKQVSIYEYEQGLANTKYYIRIPPLTLSIKS